MSNNLNKPGQRAVVRSLSERVNLLEQNTTRFVWAVNQQLQPLSQRLSVAEETLIALVALAGEEDVQSYINDRRVERAREQSDQEKASLDEGIADGYVASVEKIEEKSLIVGRYLDKDGKAMEPGRAQLVMPGIAPQFREKLLGQAVGTSLDLPEGGKFEVSEIYSIDEEKAKTVMEAKQKAAAEAAVQAAAEAEKEEEPAGEASEPTTESTETEGE